MSASDLQAWPATLPDAVRIVACHTRAVLRSRQVFTSLLVLGLLGPLALAAPTVALANGGGSAGDQQYTDPLAGVHQPKTPPPSSTPAPPPSSTPTPAPSSTPAPAPSPSSSSAPAPASGSTASGASPTTSVTAPTATIAQTPGTASAGTRQLPYTGYDGRLAAAVGFVLVLGGIGLRRRPRRA